MARHGEFLPKFDETIVMKYRKMSNRLSIGWVLICLDSRSSRLRGFAVQISRVKKLTSGATKPLVLAFSGEARGPAVVDS